MVDEAAMAAFAKNWRREQAANFTDAGGWMVQQLRKIAWISAFVCLVIGLGFSVWSAEREPDRTAQGNTQTRTIETSLLLAQATQTENTDNIAPDNPAKSAEGFRILDHLRP
jgi:hypothetical protein